MISADIVANTLEDFNKQIKELHRKHHGEDYTLNHDALASVTKAFSARLGRKCVVKEFGLNQGGTLSSLLLNEDVVEVVGCDINLNYIEPYKKLFIKYAEENNKTFSLKEISSLSDNSISSSDVLHIDTVHRGEHLLKELYQHQETVNGYIVIHDTNNLNMLKTVYKFIHEYKTWKISIEEKANVGFVVLERE